MLDNVSLVDKVRKYCTYLQALVEERSAAPEEQEGELAESPGAEAEELHVL